MTFADAAALSTRVSLGINIAVLVPVCGSLLAKVAWVDAAYGPAGPARGILLSIYMAILALSAVLLARSIPGAVLALLAVQILYKVTTPFTVGTLANPVVASNLGIAAVHAITVALILRAGA